ALDLTEPLEEAYLFVPGQRPAVLARLDYLSEPDAALVVRDVLDFVGDRPAVRLAEAGQRVGERLGRDVETKERRRDARLELRRQLRDETLRIERRVADGLRAERIEPRGEVAVHAVRLDERHR